MPRRFLIFIIFWFPMAAFAVRGFTVTREELTLMPPFCTVFYGKFVGLPQPQDSPLRNTVPPGCPALHHYCDGLKAMIRVNRYPAEKGHWLASAVRVFRSSAERKDWSGCPLRPEAYINLGKALVLQKGGGRIPVAEAELNFRKALVLKPDYVLAYYALSDYYVGLGDKKKALGVVEDGLRHVPKSEGLLKRFKELGGKTPPAPIVVKTKPDKPQQTKDASLKQPQTSVGNGNGKPGEGSASETPETKQEQPNPQKIGSPTNPWCRFCPPE